MGATGSFSYKFYKVGSLAGFFSTGALTGIWAERKWHLEGVIGPRISKDDLRDNEVHIEELNPKIQRAQSIMKYGMPQSLSPGVLYHENHVLEFDPIRKTPIWVAEHITKRHVQPEKPSANRKKSKFLADKRIAEVVRSTNDDFWDSGWSRGHMAPAGNNKHCQQVCKKFFILLQKISIIQPLSLPSSKKSMVN